MMTLTDADRIELDNKIQEILDLKNSGKFSNAIKNAEKLIAEFPRKASVYGLLASLYFETEDYSNASLHFKKATVISPMSETASLGLFHSLWGLGDHESALTEMKRFMTVADSSEYDDLKKNMKEDVGIGRHRTN